MKTFKKALLFILLIGLARFGSTHSLDPEAIMRFGQIHLSPQGLALIYIVEYGENQYRAALREYDADNNRRLDDEEINTLLQPTAEKFRNAQHISLAGNKLSLQLEKALAYASQGHHGAESLRIELGYLSELPASISRDKPLSLVYEDKLWQNSPGWKQLSFVPAEDVELVDGHIPYKEIAAFDTTAITNLNFMPSTIELKLMVSIPRVEYEQTDLQPLKSFIEKHPLFNSGFRRLERKSYTVYWIGAGIVLLFIIGVVAKQFGWVK